MQLLSEANSCEIIIYFNNRTFSIDRLPGTIFEKDDVNTIFISKEFKDIDLIPNHKCLNEKSSDYIDKNKIKEIYSINDINNIEDLIKKFSLIFHYVINDNKLIFLYIIREYIIDGKIIYDINT